MILVVSCEDFLDYTKQRGTISEENFYKTDDDALEAVAAAYSQWRGSINWTLKGLLSDDVYCGGGGRGDNSTMERVNEYQFGPQNGSVSGAFSGLYRLIFRANLCINNFEPESAIKAQVINEAKVMRAYAYFDLVTLWGPVPFVTGPLSPSEYQQSNGDVNEIWAQIEQDLTEAIASGALPVKSGPTDMSNGVRITKQAAQAFLGKAYLFEGKYNEAATVLKEVINSGLYELVDITEYENIMRAAQDFGVENIAEANYINDDENAWSQSIFANNMYGWRSDKMDLWGFYIGVHDMYPSGWGFYNPTKEAYDAFVEMEDSTGARLNATMLTYEQVMQIGAPIAPCVLQPGASLYGHIGFFDWKYRNTGSDNHASGWGYTNFTNPRVMRYAEVLLMASEACLLSTPADAPSALTYINAIRDRAQLTLLGSVTLDDIKKEKRLELWGEGVRYQDLVRWGDAATYLANQGAQVPIFSGLNPDGSYNYTFPYSNTDYGFKEGKHNLLPFPEHEMNVNKNLVQNPGW